MSERRTEGFTLIEVTVCLLLLAVGFLGVAAAQLQSLRLAAEADHRTQAMYLAEEQLSNFQAMAVNDPLLASGADPNPIEFSGDAQTQSTGTNHRHTEFYRSWRVFPDDPSVGLARIQVSVSWAQGDQQPQEPGNADNTRLVTVEGIKPTTTP